MIFEKKYIILKKMVLYKNKKNQLIPFKIIYNMIHQSKYKFLKYIFINDKRLQIMITNLY